MTLLRFCRLRFAQRLLFMDEDLLRTFTEQALPVHSAGYCDWLDDDCAAHVSVGWAWFTPAPDALRRLAPGGISCNVMLTSWQGHDLGPRKTTRLLARWLALQDWR
jgi:hypothetical protein